MSKATNLKTTKDLVVGDIVNMDDLAFRILGIEPTVEGLNLRMVDEDYQGETTLLEVVGSNLEDPMWEMA